MRGCATIHGMLPVLLALLVQSSTISGTLIAPQGMTAPGSAQVVLLPSEYAQMFNAEAQQLIDDYWSQYKPEFAANKELFFKVHPVAYREALDFVIPRMLRDTKINGSNLIRTAAAGRFEFRGIPPGDYKIIATGSIRGTDYVWSESVHVTSATLIVQMKNRVP